MKKAIVLALALAMLSALVPPLCALAGPLGESVSDVEWQDNWVKVEQGVILLLPGGDPAVWEFESSFNKTLRMFEFVEDKLIYTPVSASDTKLESVAVYLTPRGGTPDEFESGDIFIYIRDEAGAAQSVHVRPDGNGKLPASIMGTVTDVYVLIDRKFLALDEKATTEAEKALADKKEQIEKKRLEDEKKRQAEEAARLKVEAEKERQQAFKDSFYEKISLEVLEKRPSQTEPAFFSVELGYNERDKTWTVKSAEEVQKTGAIATISAIVLFVALIAALMLNVLILILNRRRR